MVATLPLALLAVLTGCGSSHHDSTADQIRAVTTRALTRSDPATCASLVTDRFLQQNWGEGETPAIEQCQFDSTLPGEPFARTLRFGSLQIHGGSAVARISVTGGEADGSRIQLQLVRQLGDWKLDRFADVQIDRPRFDAASRRDLVATGVSATDAACAVRRVRRIFDTDQIERALVTGRTRVFSAAEVTCLHRGSMIKALTIAIRNSAPKDVPAEIIDCVIRRLVKTTGTGELRVLFAAPDTVTDYFRGRARSAAKACAKESQAGLLPAPAPS
jgi:hypothetical protein